MYYTCKNKSYYISEEDKKELEELIGRISIHEAKQKYKIPLNVIVFIWNQYRRKNNIPPMLY